MNYKEIANTVCSRMPVSQITDVQATTNGEVQQLILDYVNETLFEIYATSQQWRWREVEDTFNLVPGQTDYDLETAVSDPIQPDTIKVVRNGTTTLLYVSKNQSDLNFATYSSNGSYYTIFNNTFRLFLAPNSTDEITISYQASPALLTANDDEPMIPVEYHYAIIKGAEWRVKQHQGRPEASVIKGEYDDWVRKMLKNNKAFYQAKHGVRMSPKYRKNWVR